MRGGGIQVVILLFYVLGVVAFGTGEAEKPLFQDGVLAIPKRESETEAAFAVANSE